MISNPLYFDYTEFRKNKSELIIPFKLRIEYENLIANNNYF